MSTTGNGQKESLLSQAQHYSRILLKWKWTSFTFFFLILAGATIYSFIVTPVYTARGSIWIENEANILPFEEVQTLSPGTYLQSQARLLQSRTLAAEIIDKLNLYENPDFAGKAKKGDKALNPSDPIYRELLIQGFLKNITVAATDRTQLVDVSYSARNPKLAADVLNALFEGYIEMLVRKRYSASEQATEFLNTQIEQLRAQIAAKEKELNEYGSEKDIMPLTAAEAPTVSRIEEINSALTAATLDRVNKFNAYNQIKSAPLGEIPNAPEGSIIQRLREQYINLSREYATRLATVKPEFPAMKRLKSELDAATEALQNETQNLIRNTYTEYQNALSKEQSLQKLLNSQKNEAYKANSSSVVYTSLRIELENKKSLLDSLSKRQSETDISSRLKGLETLSVWIVDKADYPLNPAFPNKRKNVVLGFFLGLAGGIGLALGLEFLNNTIKTSKDVMNSIGVPTIGSVPAFESESKSKGAIGEFAKVISVLRGSSRRGDTDALKHRKNGPVQFLGFNGTEGDAIRDEMISGKIELIAIREPLSIQAESYRSIRTTLLISSPPGRIKTILFTSPLAREGKSSTVSNIGITLAETGKRVVIIDSDLRKPRQARIFGVNNKIGPGLSSYLSSLIEPTDVLRPTLVPNLQLIASGPMPANPIELLSSERMDNLVAYLKRNFDFALFDTPPLLAVSDALAMGPMADAIIFVARVGQTPVPAFRQAKQKLESHKLKCLGVILNGVDLLEQDGYYAKEYYHYSKPE